MNIELNIEQAIEIFLNLSFRGAAATRNLKVSSLCSGNGFLPTFEMTEKTERQKQYFSDIS